MRAALELADQGFRVSLVERQADLGGNMHHLRFMLSHADPGGVLKEMIERTLDHPRIHTVLGAEILRVRGQPRQVQDDPAGGGGASPLPEEIVIQHGVVIVATGAQAYHPTEYLYGQDDRIITQKDLEAAVADRPDDVRQLQSVGDDPVCRLALGGAALLQPGSAARRPSRTPWRSSA